MTQINAGLGFLIQANIINIYILIVYCFMEIRSGKGLGLGMQKNKKMIFETIFSIKTRLPLLIFVLKILT